MDEALSFVLHSYRKIYESQPEFAARAPGRVNLIGDHTDYNEGWVLPMAINLGTVLAAGRTAHNALEIHARRMGESVMVPLEGELPVQPGARWANYLLAVAEQFRARGHALPGLRVVVDGDLPLGAGLSSSASLEVAFAALLNEVCGASLTRREIGLLAQAAEHSRYVGVQCGIMDQLASALPESPGALLLDCRTLQARTVEFPDSKATLLIVDSRRERTLAGSAYNTRRGECEQARRALEAASGVRLAALRDVTPELLAAHEAALPPLLAKRAGHVVSENERVLRCAAALEAGNVAAAGRLFRESHRSLARDYEVSCPELDEIAAVANRTNGVPGCRMTGAGFGGCAVALVEPDAEPAFRRAVSDAFAARNWNTPGFHPVKPACGAECFRLQTA